MQKATDLENKSINDCVSISRNFYTPMNFDKAIFYFKLVHVSKKSSHLSSVGPETLAFGRQFSAKFQPIFDCVVPNVKFKYEDSGNTKTDCVDTVFSTYIKSNREACFEDTRYIVVFSRWNTAQIMAMGDTAKRGS